MSGFLKILKSTGKIVVACVIICNCNPVDDMPETEELSWISRPLKSYWQPLNVLTAVGGMYSPMELDSIRSLNCSSDDSVFYECFDFLLFFVAF